MNRAAVLRSPALLLDIGVKALLIGLLVFAVARPDCHRTLATGTRRRTRPGTTRYPSEELMCCIGALRSSFAAVSRSKPFAFARAICARLSAVATPRLRCARFTA